MTLSSQQINKLFQSQLEEWPLAKTNFEALEEVESKDFYFDDFTIRVQFNPARIQSSAAKVDAKSISERKCFLCPANLPEVQRGIPFGEYQVLVNPFPIFPEHFTIPTYQHTDQLILDRFGDMLELARCMDGYTIFYNGPKCGASAPDHAHFQAGIKGFLPIEKEIGTIAKEKIRQTSDMSLYAIRGDYGRNSFLIESKDKEEAISCFRKIYGLLEIKHGDSEPMMNLLAWYAEGKWYSIVFPRQKHRPDCFYAEGGANLLISPATVDLGGVFITPLEKDFNKITREDIKDILSEICISASKMQVVIDKLKE